MAAGRSLVRKLLRPGIPDRPALPPAAGTRPRRPQQSPPASPASRAGRAATHPISSGYPASAAPAAPAADPRYRFLSRFGATLLSGGIAAIPMALYHYQAELGLAPQEVWFVGYILAHRWTDSLPYPSLRQMSRRTGVSVQMLHRYKQSLIEKGYLITFPRHRPSGGRSSNSYDFSELFQHLETFLVRDRRDASWRPTADEPEGEPLDAEPQKAGDDSVPESHQVSSAGWIAWGDVADVVRQRELTGPSGGGLTGDSHGEATAPQTDSLTGHVVRSTQQEERLRSQVNRKGLARPEGAVPGAERSLTLRKESASAAVIAATTPSGAPSLPLGPAVAATDDLWQRAASALAATVSPAAYQAWIAPLRPEPGPLPQPRDERPAGRSAASATATANDTATAAPVRLVCATAFQRDQIERRYRRLIEDAIGRPVELIVRSEAT